MGLQPQKPGRRGRRAGPRRLPRLHRIFNSVHSVRKSERPTLAPRFDVGQFARDSDRRLRSAAPGPNGRASQPDGAAPGPNVSLPTPSVPMPVPSVAMPTPNVAEAPRADTRGLRVASPPPSGDADRCVKISETRLVTRRLGAFITNEAWARLMSGCPVVAMTADALRRLPLDHRAGFVLSLMDGTIELDTVIELCSMPRDEALTLIRDLYESEVVRFK